MILTLEVTNPEAKKLGAAQRKTFDAAGGTIGRLPDNSWVLQDPYVSSRHAVIRYAHGVFYIEDTSTNGVFINSPDRRLGTREPYAIKSGDRIFIEPYEIKASISGAPEPDAFGPVVDDPFAIDPGQAPVPTASESAPAGDVDPLNLLGFDAKRKGRAGAPEVPRAADLARNSVLSDHYEAPGSEANRPPPAAEATGGLIPDEYDPLRSDDSQIPAPPAAPSRPRPSRAAVAPAPPNARQPPPASDDALRGVLAGAGLDAAAVTPELARSFGEILRVVVSGVMDILQARQRIKDEFRMRITSFRRTDNNPLKFSANVDDALHNLLVKRNPAYLPPVEAFEDAFDDLRNHQMAMLAGLRAAFDAMLAEFDPERLQAEFDRDSKKGALLSMPAKLRYWDLYREKVHDMVRDSEVSFRELFGEEFAKAYEAQLERLKAQNRSRHR